MEVVIWDHRVTVSRGWVHFNVNDGVQGVSRCHGDPTPRSCLLYQHTPLHPQHWLPGRHRDRDSMTRDRESWEKAGRPGMGERERERGC